MGNIHRYVDLRTLLMTAVLWPALAIAAIIGGAVLAVIVPNGFVFVIVVLLGFCALGAWAEREES